MPMPWEKEFYTGKKGGLDIWDIGTLGGSELAQQYTGKDGIKDVVGEGLMQITEPLTGTRAARAARQAAKKQQDYGQRALDLQERMYEEGREDLMPWREAGQGALAKLVAGMNSGQFNPSLEGFEADPGYQFRLGEGQKALERGASAGGRTRSVRQLKDLMRFGQGMASDEFGRYQGRLADQYNRLAGLSGTGRTTSQSMANMGQMYGQQAGQGLTNMGNVEAASIIGQQRAKSQGMQNLTNLATQAGAAYLTGGMSLPFTSGGGNVSGGGYQSPWAMFGGNA